ncbi:MAG: hypothetical protein Q8Q92_03035, partial [bacterium]|nr:hypothetical protein [bacterium]
MPQGLTLEQLRAMGSKPVRSGGLTLEELRAMGSRPVQSGGLTLKELRAQQNQQPQQQSLADKIWGGIASVGRPLGQVGLGAVKEAGKTALGLAKIGGKAVDIVSPGQPFAARLGREEDIQKVLEPEGTA